MLRATPQTTEFQFSDVNASMISCSVSSGILDPTVSNINEALNILSNMFDATYFSVSHGLLQLQSTLTIDTINSDYLSVDSTASINTLISDNVFVTSLNIDNLPVNRLIATDGNKNIVSTNIYDWINDTPNQVIVTNEGDGIITLSLPQDIDTTSSPIFENLTLTGNLVATLTINNGLNITGGITEFDEAAYFNDYVDITEIIPTGTELEVRGDIISEGTYWSSRTSAEDNDWRSVCYGNGLFVAVASSGTGNRVMTSPDGINWTIRVSDDLEYEDCDWQSICYGDGIFIAVASSGTADRVLTSTDGINWMLRDSPVEDNDWRSICYGDGLFVVVASTGTSDRVMTTPNGIDWTIRTSAEDNDWRSVCYGNGLFVAVSITGVGNRVMTSPDGINWTSRTSAADNDWRSVCYGNGLFVAVASSGTGNRVMTSPDGINWTLRTSAENNNWYGVCYGNGLFVAVAASGTGNRVMTSGKEKVDQLKHDNTYHGGMNIYGELETIGNIISEGTHWTIGVSAADNSWVSVCYGNGLFVAVSSSGNENQVMTSPDGINWKTRTPAMNVPWWSVCYGNGLFVAVTTNNIMTSQDGITWSSRTSPGNNSWVSVCYGNGLFVAVASSGIADRVMTSQDGINWTLRTAAANNDWQSVCYGNGLFVAVSSSGTGNRVMTSPDGITWTIRTSASNNSWRSVCYGKGLFVAVGGTNSIMTSSDGITWESRTSVEDLYESDWWGVCYGNGLFVAVSSNDWGSRVMTSTNGINWISRDAPYNGWQSVCYGNGLFVAISNIGSGNRVMISGTQETIQVYNDHIYHGDMTIYGNVGIGLIPTDNMTGLSIESGILVLKETTTPIADDGYVKIYPKDDNEVYFQDATGIEHTFRHCDSFYAEMYLDNNANPTVIETANTNILVRNFTGGSLNGWTFNAGSTGSITAYINYHGTVPNTTRVTSDDHGLITGDEVSIQGTTSYNGVHTITKIDDNSFYINVVFVADEGASSWDEGSYIEADVGATGIYMATCHLSGTPDAGTTWTLNFYKNSTTCPKCIGQRKFANNDIGSLIARSIIDVSDGDRIYLSITNVGASSNIILKYGNITIHRM